MFRPCYNRTSVHQQLSPILTATQHKIKREQYAILFTIADRRKKDRIDIHDWSVFNNLLAKADSEYYVAFQLFADQDTGLVDLTPSRNNMLVTASMTTFPSTGTAHGHRSTSAARRTGTR